VEGKPRKGDGGEVMANLHHKIIKSGRGWGIRAYFPKEKGFVSETHGFATLTEAQAAMKREMKVMKVREKLFGR